MVWAVTMVNDSSIIRIIPQRHKLRSLLEKTNNNDDDDDCAILCRCGVLLLDVGCYVVGCWWPDGVFVSLIE